MKKLRLALFILLIAVMATIFVACDLGSKDKDKDKTKPIDVNDMQVVGEIEGDIYFDPDSNSIKWNAVDKATTYYVKYGSGDSERKFTNASAGIAGFSGDNEFSVYAVRDDNTKTAVKKQVFSTPELNIKIDKERDAVTWTGDEGASGYDITIRNADDRSNNDIKEFSVEAGSSSAPLDYITGNGSRYFVTVAMKVNRGTTIPCQDSLTNIRRVKSKPFLYDGVNHRFMTFPTPIPGENAKYTHHITIGAQKIAVEDGSTTYYYEPDGGDFTATLYTSSNKANYLNSVSQTVTVTEKPTVDNLTCNNAGLLSWSEAQNAGGYSIFLDDTSIASTADTSYNITSKIPLGRRGAISVCPYYSENAYAPLSDAITVFSRGSSINIGFYCYEPTFGQVDGTHTFTVTGANADQELTGFYFDVNGDTTPYNFAEENTRILYVTDYDFADAGTYVVTVTPKYDLPTGTISLGEDRSATYTVTRLPDMTSAEVRNVDGTGRIYMTGVTGERVAVYDKINETQNINYSTPTQSGSDYTLGLFNTANNTRQKKDFAYTLYNVAPNAYVSLSGNNMVLRSLHGLDIAYSVVGKVGTPVTVSATGLSWEYDEEAVFNVLDTNDGISVVQSAKTFDLTSYIAAGTFNDGARHTISITVRPDPDNLVFSPAQPVVNRSFYGAVEPSFVINSDSLTIMTLQNNRSNAELKVSYVTGDNAGQTLDETLTGKNYTISASHDGATILIRNVGYTEGGRDYVNSPWVEYSVVLPEVTDTDVVCNSNKTVSWTAVSGISSYKYVISGDGSATADRVTSTSTSSLASILTGRKTFSITVSGYGSKNENVFYLPREILTDTFYSVKLEVTEEFEYVNNHPTRVFYTARFAPTGYEYVQPTVRLRGQCGSYDANTTFYVDTRTEMSDFIDNNVLPNSEVNNGSYKSATLTFSVSVSEEALRTLNKTFLIEDSLQITLRKYRESNTVVYFMTGS